MLGISLFQWLVVLVFAVCFALYLKLTSYKPLHGKSRFATKREVRKYGLFRERGVLLGKWGKDFLCFGGSQHVLVSAPTRSGKGVGVIIPNLLSWNESVVVLDIKKENWEITSQYRKNYGQACFLFAPLSKDRKSHRYNPLGYVSSDLDQRVSDIQKIATILIPDLPKTDPIWTAMPRNLFVGMVLYLTETPEKPLTIGQVMREILGSSNLKQHLEKIVLERNLKSPLSLACVSALNTFLAISSDLTRSGIVASLISRLEIWLNPEIDAITAANDFDLRDIRKKRMSIYVGISPDNLLLLTPLANLFFQHLIDLNTRELPHQDISLKHACLLVLDEFAALGRMPVISKSVAFLAGYNLRLLSVIQSKSQLVELYGKESTENLLANHAAHIVFPPKASEIGALKDLSEFLGSQTVKQKSRSKEIKGLFSWAKSDHIADQKRPLLLPQEISELGPEKALLFLENLRPVLAQKIVYFRDSLMVSRLIKLAYPSLKWPWFFLGYLREKRLNQAIRSGRLAGSVPTLEPVLIEAKLAIHLDSKKDQMEASPVLMPQYANDLFDRI